MNRDDPRNGGTRRAFVATLGAGVATSACAPALRLVGRSGHDLVLRGGTVFDGSGAAGVEADVAIDAGRIVAVGDALPARGREEIDVRGVAVAPGFVDIHSHGDSSLFDDPRAESVVRQGVTTIVVGQDGSSPAPNDRDGDAGRALRGAYGRTGVSRSFSDFFRSISMLPSAVNVTSMVGLGSIRRMVVGEADRPATPGELSRMRALVEGALADGACGASSGLEYTPGSFAGRHELAALCRPLEQYGLPYATHLRNEDDRLIDAIDEAIEIARGAGCALQISHLKTSGPRNFGKIGDALARIERAKESGLDVAFDRYPYVAYSTGLTNLFPIWARDGGDEAFLARLADPATAARIRTETLAKVETISGWDSVLISQAADPRDRAAEGKKLGEYATSSGSDPYDVAVAMLQRNRADVGTVVFAMSEANLQRFLAHPLGMVCSDGGAFAIEGPARRGHPHPRGLGTFPRLLARYVRETKTLTLPQAIHKMSGFPASRVGLADRGRLAAGMAADVVVFDPAAVADRATFAQPFQYPDGIRLVIVNGEIALRDGERSQNRRGRGLTAGVGRGV